MKIIYIVFVAFSFLLSTEISFAETKKIYPYKQIKLEKDNFNFASFYKNSNTIVFLDNDHLVFHNLITGKVYKGEIAIKGYKLSYPIISPNHRYIVFEGYEGEDNINYKRNEKKYFCIVYDLEKNTYKKIVQDINIVVSDSSFSNDSNYLLLRVADDVYVYNTKEEKIQSIFKNLFDYYSEPSY